ncbi:MAG: hypothetical protein J6U54_18980 [Clostridiales bacterium]|nr:hypothetical protein [Clostridiales bacterium]
MKPTPETENYYTDSPSEGLVGEMIWGAVLAIPSLAITIAALFSFIK